MEAPLARCLLIRPAPRLSRPSLSCSEPYGARISPRYSSTDSSGRYPWRTQPKTETKSSTPADPAKPSTRSDKAAQPANPAEFSDVINKLDFGGRNQTPAGPGSADPRTRRYIDHRDPSRDGYRDIVSEDQRTVARTQRDRMANHQNFKLGPELGRQVLVEPERGFDLNAALRQLQINCSSNRVRAQKAQQKFHTRRGQKLKNLRRERWRKLFKFSFIKTIDRVQRMKQQGW